MQWLRFTLEMNRNALCGLFMKEFLERQDHQCELLEHVGIFDAPTLFSWQPHAHGLCRASLRCKIKTILVGPYIRTPMKGIPGSCLKFV